MSDITIVENEFITVKYLAEHEMIFHTIHQPVQGKPLRSALNAGTEALKQYGVCKWLSDDRKNGQLTPEDAEWGFNDWNRRTIDAGWKFWANVVPVEAIAAGSLMPTINALYDLGLRMMVFDNVDDAMVWLNGMSCE